MKAISPMSYLFLFLTCASAFSSTRQDRQFGIIQHNIIISFPSQTTRTTLFSTSPTDEETVEENEKSKEPVPTPSAPIEPEGTSYPLDLPSPLLLSTSMVLAITGTGSVFELTGGAPTLGFGTAAAVAAVSIPTCLFLFYASILKATAETEADDEEFMKGKY